MRNKRIVTIHAVDNSTFTPKKLINYIKTMRFLGYKFVSVDEILSSSSNDKLIALTVDDAYKSCINNLVPILETFQIPALMFIPVGLLGKKADDKDLQASECYPNQDIMDVNDVNLWLNKGFQIGYHTYNHIDLYHANDKNIIENDFCRGVHLMQTMGWYTTYFAYPKGFLPKERTHFEILMKKAGIKYAFTINWGDVNIESPYYINRICLGNKENFIWTIIKSIGFADFYFYKKKIYKEQTI